MLPPSQARDESTVKLLRHLFHEVFVPEDKIPPDKAGFIMPVYFFGWLDKHMSSLNPSEICESLNIDYSIWEFLQDILNSGMAVERLHGVWYTVVLSKRPRPQHDLLRLNMVMLMTYADGTIFPMQLVITREMMDKLGFDDALLTGLIAQRSQEFTQALITDGIDGLHDKGKDYRGTTQEDPFEVCMGLLISPIKFDTPMLRAELKPCCELYARLFQAICRPVIPAAVKQHIEMEKRKHENKGPGGGWDV